MVIQNLYETGSAGIISVGYTDVATGKSRTNLYAGLLSGASGVLSNIKFYSNGLSINCTGTPISFDMDFDISQRIQGQTIFQIPMAATYSSGGTGVSNSWIDIFLQKVNADNSITSILSGSTSVFVNNNIPLSGAMLVKALDFPLTGFKSGEKLRMVFTGKYANPDSGACTITLLCDPMDRFAIGYTKGQPDTTQLVIQTPFKVDL